MTTAPTLFMHSRPVFPAHFIGREDETGQILSQLANPARGSSAISGDPRVGKTSLLHYLREPKVREGWGLSPNWCYFLYLDCHSIVPFSEAAFWRHILRELRRHLGSDEVLRETIQQLLAQTNPDIYDLNSLFDDIARTGRLVVLLLDEFEGAIEHLDRHSPELLYHLRALLNRPERGLALVVASRHSLEQLCAVFRFHGSPFDNAFSLINLPPFSETEVDQLLVQYQADFAPTERTYLRRVAGTHPYLVQLAASFIVRTRGDQTLAPDALVQIEADLERETEGYFSDLFSYSSEREQMLLAWLALTQLNQHLSTGRAKLGDLIKISGRYDQELARLVKRGLVLNQADKMVLFSPIFAQWVLRQVVIAGGQEFLSRWEVHAANFLSLDQMEAFKEMVSQIISWPAVIKRPELLTQQPPPQEEANPALGLAGPQRLDRYIIEALIDRGGMTDILKARDPRLNRPVAIKKLRTRAAETDEVRARFEREAQAIATLRHPHIVQIYDFGVQNGHYYMVMEFIQGHNLKEHLHNLRAAGQTLPLPEVLHISTHVADALDYAHRHQMIHRDVKPSNILLADNGDVFLADFGLVRVLGQSGLTHAGRLIGTFAYMAPEQVKGESKGLDYRVDIYALGCVVYEMLTGHSPFQQADLPLAHLRLSPVPPHLLVPDLPEAASQVILKALAKEPAERPRSASRFIQDLRQTLSMPYSIRLHGAISLSDEQKALLKQLYSEISQPRLRQVNMYQELQGGLSGATVILVQPVDDRGRGLAQEVVKFGPATGLRREYDQYRRFVKGRLPMTAVTLERGPVELDTLACLSYGFVEDQPNGKVHDLETYYALHSASKIIETLARLMKPLDVRWYGQSEPLLTSFDDEYGRYLPPHLTLAAERFLPNTDFTPGLYRPIDLETILTLGAGLETGERIAVRDLQVDEIKAESVKLRSAGDGPVIWIKAKVTAPPSRLKEGDWVNVGGVIETRRNDVLRAAAARALELSPAISTRPDGYLNLEGLDQPCPHPLILYPSVLKRPLIGRRSIIHGDLHPGNILIDESSRGWLIDFDHVREGHVLFDFIRLESLLRSFILGNLRHFLKQPAPKAGEGGWPHPFSLAEYSIFEAALLRHLLGQPVEPVSHAPLNKAFTVILAIRRLAQPYLRSPNDWGEYLIGLFLHNVSQLKFYPDYPHINILPLITAAVLGQEISHSSN